MMSASGTSAASAVLKSTPEKRNFLLLIRLLIAGGTRLVRDVFDRNHPPHTLAAVLSSPLALSKLKRPHVIKPQLDLLYPAPGVYGKSEDFDITLLFKLLREICGLTPPVSTGSWDKLPGVTDLSLEADLARLKFYRNDIYGHTSTMEVSEADFSVYWKIIREAMERLANSISPAKETEWKNAIDQFHADPLTPEDEENVTELKRWYLIDMETKKEVSKLQRSVTELKTTMTNKWDDIYREVKDKADEIKQILSEVKSAEHSLYKNPHSEETAGGTTLNNQSQAMDIHSSSSGLREHIKGPSTSRDHSWMTQPLPPEISIFDSDIECLAKQYDPSTRQWLLEDFQTWFNNSCETVSRAYVLVGDAGIGKSVMAAVLAKQMKAENQLGAAFFCSHNNSTRRDPRYLISSVAYQLCSCNTMYNERVGGFYRIQKFVANHELGVLELFTKLLQEPLSQCPVPAKRQLVVVDALDESQYEGHSDLLDLIIKKFQFLPPWIVFFITSRPEERIQANLEDFRPCVRICSSDGHGSEYFKKHCDDLSSFIKGKVKGVFSNPSCNTEELETEVVEKIFQKCEGLFLYARHIVELMQSSLSPLEVINYCPRGVRQFYLSNFKRILAVLGEVCFKELVGCAVVSPGPLPTAFISVILNKCGSHLTKQKVLDTISLFFLTKSSEDTFSFLHSLMPSWLCNEKEAQEVFIDQKAALKTLSDIIRKDLDGITHNKSLPDDLKIYVLRYGIRFLCQNSVGEEQEEEQEEKEKEEEEEEDSLYSCLTNLAFVEAKLRINRAMVYCLIDDYQIFADTFRSKLTHDQILTLELYRKIILENALLLSRFPYLVHQLMPRESGKCQQSALDVNMKFFSLKPCSSFHYAFSSSRSLVALITEEESKWFITIISVFPRNVISKVIIPFKCRKPLFSPSDDFVFLGRVDKWFSVLEGTIVDLPQFASVTGCFDRAVFLNGNEFLVVGRDGQESHFFCHLFILFLFWNSGVFADDSDLILGFLQKRLSEAQKVTASLALRKLNDWITAGSKITSGKIFFEFLGVFCCFVVPFIDLHVDSCEELALHYFIAHFCKCQDLVARNEIWHFKTGQSVMEMYSNSELLQNYHVIMTAFAKAWCNSSRTAQEIPIKSNACLWYIFGSQCFGKTAEVKSFQGGFAVLWDGKVVLFTNDRLYILSSPLRVSSFEVSPNGMWVAVCGSFHSSVSVCDMQLCNTSNKSVLSVMNVCRPDQVKIVDSDILRFRFSRDNRQVLYQKQNGFHYAYFVEDNSVLKEPSSYLKCLLTVETRSANVLLEYLASEYTFMLSTANDIVGICFFLSCVVVVCSGNGETSISKLEEEDGVMFSLKKNVFVGVDSTKSTCLISKENSLIVALDNTIAVLSKDFDITWTIKVASFEATVLSCSCDGKRILLCLSDGIVQIVDVMTQEKVVLGLRELNDFIKCGCFVPRHESLVVLCGENGVQIWENVQKKFLEKRLIQLPNPQVNFLFCTCSVKGDLLACCIEDTVKVFSLFPNERPILREKVQLSGHCGAVRWCQFLKEGRYLVTHGVDCCILFWDLRKQDPMGCTSFTWCKREVVAVAVSEKEDILMCALSSGLLAEINLEGLDAIKQYSSSPVPSQPWKFCNPAVMKTSGLSVTVSHFHDVDSDVLMSEHDEFCVESDNSSDNDDDDECMEECGSES